MMLVLNWRGGGGEYLFSRVVACCECYFSIFEGTRDSRKPGPYAAFESYYSDVQRIVSHASLRK